MQYAWKNRLGPEALFNGHRSCSDRLAAFGRFRLPQENRSYKFFHIKNGNTAKLTRLVKALNEHRSRMA